MKFSNVFAWQDSNSNLPNATWHNPPSPFWTIMSPVLVLSQTHLTQTRLGFGQFPIILRLKLGHFSSFIVFSWIESDHKPPVWRLRNPCPYLRILWSQFHRLTVHNNLLCRDVLHFVGTTLQVVDPASLVHDVLTHVHGHPSAGHYGPVKTLESFYWPYMSSLLTLCCLSVKVLTCAPSTSTSCSHIT